MINVMPLVNSIEIKFHKKSRTHIRLFIGLKIIFSIFSSMLCIQNQIHFFRFFQMILILLIPNPHN